MKRINYRRMFFVVLFSVLSLGIAPLGSEAVQIEYQFEGTGVSGSVAGTNFVGANFLISVFGDDVFAGSDLYGSFISGLTGTIDLFGGSFADPSPYSGGAFLDSDSNPLTFNVYTFVDDIVWFETSDYLLVFSFYSTGTGLGTYALKGPFGPVDADENTISIPVAAPINTSFGQLVFDDIPDTASFQALVEVPQSVPEPASLILLGSGLFVLLGFRRKARK